MVSASNILMICLFVTLIILMVVYAILKCRVKNEYIRKLELEGDQYLTKKDLVKCLEESREQMTVYL